MLPRRPWLKDAKVTHDWGNNTMALQGNVTIKTIILIKHLGVEVKRPKLLLCYHYQNRIIDKEDIIFVTELEMFSIGIINLPKNFHYVETTKSIHIDIEV
jgi:hypothetical protein